MAFPSLGKSDDKEDAVTFEEAIATIGTGYFQYKMAIIGGIIIMSSYFAVGVITFVLPVAHCDLKIDYEDRGNLASISFVGLIFSCHMWGFLSDTLGRRYILIRCLICDAVLYLLTMMTPHFYLILFLRFFNGVASCGGVVSIYAYIGEFQTDKFRSRALMISSFIAASAYTLIPALAWLIIPQKWEFELYPGLIFKSWRIYYVACGLPSLLSAILLFFLPESPKFLLAKGKNEKAMEVLERMYQENHKKGDIFPIKSIITDDGERVGRLDITKHKAHAVGQLLWNQTSPLLKKPFRFNFTLLCVALFICYFCNNGLYVWLPEAINRMALYKNLTGRDEGSFCEILGCDNIYSTVENSTQKILLNDFYIDVNNMNLTGKVQTEVEGPVCFDDVDTTVYLDYIIFGTCTLVVWIIITVTIKYIKKKYVILFLTACNLLVTISMKWSNVLVLMPIKAYLIMLFISGIFPILNSVVVDLFPTKLRAMAGCLTLMASRLGSVVTHETTGLLIKSHCSILMWNYIVLAAVCLLSVSLLPSSPPKLPPSTTPTPKISVIHERRPEEV